jgi:outer membrane protein TolC
MTMSMSRIVLVFALACIPGLAQSGLSLSEAVRTALKQHPAIAVAGAQTRAATHRVGQARSGYLPRLEYSESFARSNNPVFVFSSLLTQRQFAEDNFAIDSLNRPDALNNFQSQLNLDQTVYDWGGTRAQVRAAELKRDISREQERRASLDLIARVVRSYLGAVLAQEQWNVAKEAVKSAQADLDRALTVRQAGMSTDADVLSIRVHLAAVKESEIRAGAEVEFALSALNEALGLPLDTTHTLITPLSSAPPSDRVLKDLDSAAERLRPEARQVQLAMEVADQQRLAARSALLPQFGVRAAFEADRQRFVTRGGANWLVSGSIRWNLFDGFGTRERMVEAAAALDAARAQRAQTANQLSLQVRRAWADVRSAEERISVASASVAQAEESLRITRNRFEAGLATVTDLLRTQTALLESRTRRLAAIHDQRVAVTHLEYSSGTLTPESEVLR